MAVARVTGGNCLDMGRYGVAVAVEEDIAEGRLREAGGPLSHVDESRLETDLFARPLADEAMPLNGVADELVVGRRRRLGGRTAAGDQDRGEEAERAARQPTLNHL